MITEQQTNTFIHIIYRGWVKELKEEKRITGHHAQGVPEIECIMDDECYKAMQTCLNVAKRGCSWYYTTPNHLSNVSIALTYSYSSYLTGFT